MNAKHNAKLKTVLQKVRANLAEKLGTSDYRACLASAAVQGGSAQSAFTSLAFITTM